ncbi:DUF502 domain-containing protein [Alkalilacustris brevis]|uniref:DUF502 domain-containing protein n=1 Tax=Alkalilacustris brevis TaxID=2026338 RepID=UPI000E0CC924|nr:DUF502 domain-containing protein [Alkalilacustris brevis]
MNEQTPQDPPPQPPQPPQRRGILHGLRTSFLTGVVVIVPIWLTLWLIWTVVNWIDGWVLPFVPSRYRPSEFLLADVPGLGVILFLVFAVLVGWMAKGLIGRTFLGWGESIVDRMPIVRTVYNGIKQIAETVFAQTESNFDRACLVEYPRKGVWAVAFVSTTAKGEVARSLDGNGTIISVFLPTTPNPTSGFLLFVPAKDVIPLDMKVEDAAKLVISAGLVYPNPKNPQVPPPRH